MNGRRTFNICLTVVITAAFILLGAFVFGDSYLRFGETAKDFGLSVGYYFCTLFGLDHDITPSVTEYSSVMDWDILRTSCSRRISKASLRRQKVSSHCLWTERILRAIGRRSEM